MVRSNYIGRRYDLLRPRGTFDVQSLRVGPFWTWYNGYLKSDVWAEVRHLVLTESPCCAHCTNAATDVHHMTYVRVGHERWGDVQALCTGCHAQVHQSGVKSKSKSRRLKCPKKKLI